MDSIEIKGYKSIKEARVELRPINILIGANGSGKSNFLSFFEFLKQLYNRNLVAYVAQKGYDKLLFQGAKRTDGIYFHIEFDGENNGYEVELKWGDYSFNFMKEILLYNGDRRPLHSYGKQEAEIKLTDNRRAPYVLRYLNGLKRYHFHDTTARSPFMESSVAGYGVPLESNGRNLAAFLYQILRDDKKTYHWIVSNIQSVAPYFEDFYFPENDSDESRFILQWQDKYSETIYNATTLSDGTLRFIALSALFLQPELPNTIIIDEPELGLHPFALGKLAGMIRSASKRGCQVIVATQSVDLISHFEPEDIITVDLVDGQSHFKRLNSEELRIWLDDDYTLGDLWKRNVIDSGQPNYSV